MGFASAPQIDQSTEQKNKGIVSRLYEETNKMNLAALDELFDTSYVDHNPPPIPNLASGLPGVKQAFQVFVQAFPDGHHAIDELIAQGDKVVSSL